MMTNTVIVKVKDPSVGIEKITESVNEIVAELKTYVPGYQLRMPPVLDGDRVTTIIQVEGQGDFLPVYSGNLDIINAAAVAAAERLAQEMLAEEGLL
jgi:acetaldehyde dehydrogenase